MFARLLIVRFGKKLREGTEETLHEPLPEGWEEIIKRLNDEEQTERKNAEVMPDAQNHCSQHSLRLR